MHSISIHANFSFWKVGNKMPDNNPDVWQSAHEISEKFGIIEFAGLIVHMNQIIADQQREIDTLEKYHESNARRAKSLDSVRDIALDLVQDLARCGGYAHKEKNEAILAVISRLMAIHSNYAPFVKMTENQDVPF